VKNQNIEQETKMAIFRMDTRPPKFPLRAEYPWKEMKVMDQAIFPNGWDHPKVRASAHGYMRHKGIRFRTKIQGNNLHVWRIA
jgi:hypothetical protein